MVGAARQALLLAALLALPVGAEALADEGGGSFWTPGSYANRAALPPPPGWSLAVQLYYYNGKAPDSATPSSAVLPGTRSKTMEFSLTPTYELETPVLGGELAFFATAAASINTFHLDNAALAANVDDRVSGIGDLSPGVSLNWTHGANNWLVYLLGNVPSGVYDSQRSANVGIGHGAVDAGGGYTYYVDEVGLTWSSVLGFTYNLENHTTAYRSGIDSHLGWGLSKSISTNWRGGVAGYVFYQLSGDSGSGDTCGACKSRVASVGPEAIYLFNVAGQEWSLDLRAYYEFWAQNRLQGVAAFVTLSIPLSSPTK
jgi:hypothetical protein